jgi:hypothetical protein
LLSHVYRLTELRSNRDLLVWEQQVPDTLVFKGSDFRVNLIPQHGG